VQVLTNMSILVAKEKLLDEGVHGVFTPSSPPLLERSVRWLRMPLRYPRIEIGSPVGGPHSLGEIRGAAAVNVLSRLFAFAAHGGALGQERR
jgi:hypothetical protein